MKSSKLYVTGILAAVSLALTGVSSRAQTNYIGPTNFVAYSFDGTNNTAAGWGNWFGGDYVTNFIDSQTAYNNTPASQGGTGNAITLQLNVVPNQYVFFDGYGPTYGPLSTGSKLIVQTNGGTLNTVLTFTNMQFAVIPFNTNAAAGDMQIRTTANPPDFGVWRVGTRGPSFSQDWYYYYSIPITNSLGQWNSEVAGVYTNWTHISVDLSGIVHQYPDLAGGLINTMFGADNGAYNPTLIGTQYIDFDDIEYNGWIGPVPPPTLSISKATPGLYLFPGNGQYGRSELQITTNQLNGGWIGAGTTYPVSYSFTVVGNATTEAQLDTHLTFLPSPPDTPEGNSGADYQQANCLWLQLLSGSGANTQCRGNLSWKTNSPGSNPNSPTSNGFGGVVVYFTNSVRAGTWTVTWNSDVAGTITCPAGSSNNLTANNIIPFDLTAPSATTNNTPGGNKIAPATTSAEVDANFANPMYVRFGDMNFGNAGRTIPDVWNNISVSGTAGTNFSVDFTHQAWNYSVSNTPSGLDENLWDLTSSDGGATVTILVPTNANYWVKWKQPDAGWNNLCTATNIAGPWKLASFYNNYMDPTNALGEIVPAVQTLQGGSEWNLMLTNYLPTVNAAAGGALAPNAYFRLQEDGHTPPL